MIREEERTLHPTSEKGMDPNEIISFLEAGCIDINIYLYLHRYRTIILAGWMSTRNKGIFGIENHF